MTVVRVYTQEPIGVEVPGNFGRKARLESIVRNHRFRRLFFEILPPGKWHEGRCPARNSEGKQCQKTAGHGRFHGLHSSGPGWNETWL